MKAEAVQIHVARVGCCVQSTENKPQAGGRLCPDAARIVPVAKKRSSPLCRNPSIATEISVTHMVTDRNPANT